ncbi:hypothetical protein PVK06_010045 [Gossypium arboreum]|uniref:Agglutinin domain-containing protein n=1 Tax=Gossypium arboreum TaxID=29729 RepID=A0ABR0QPA5_GOSAR|nr:hypothetical protein PVK06_010045 [Gossypium arboreum]
MALTLPKFIVLKPSDNNVRSGDFRQKWIGAYKKLPKQQVLATNQNRFHRWSPTGAVLIAATAQNKEEDQSKETWSDLLLNRCVLANYREFDSNGHDIFSIIDYDIGETTVACETFVTDDRKVHIKSICAGKFWWADPKWIWVGYEDPRNNDGTTFLPVKVDDKTIGLINLGNNNFCTTLTGQNDVAWLSPAVPTITKEAKLTVEEPVLTRDIYDVKYDLGNSRVYDETTFIIAKNFASNYIQEPTHMNMKLSYTNIKTSTWKSNFPLKLAMEAKMEFNVPLISQGNIEMSGEFHSDVKWEETKESKTLVDVVHTIVVPAMTNVTVNLIATKGKCDVLFTFMQSDTLYDGTIVITEVQGATYTGSNYYSIHFETEETKLEPRKKPEPL